MRGTSALALGCLALLYSLPNAESRREMEVESDGRRTQRLAVVLTTSNDGDSMQEGRWPTRCSPGEMAGNIDLVLYQSDLDNVNSTDPPPEAGSGCFARVRTIHGGQVDHDTEDSSSADMVYSMFLDGSVRWQLHEYDAIAVMPSWNVAAAVTTEFSMDALYDTAFPNDGRNDYFWVKTLALEGDLEKLRGGSSADASEATPGDITIFNNVDKEFVRFVHYTSKHQQDREIMAKQSGRAFNHHSFGDALSLTLMRDPLYEKHAPMFVATSLAFKGSTDGQNSAPATSMKRELRKAMRQHGSKDRTLKEQTPKWKKKWKKDDDYDMDNDMDEGDDDIPKWKRKWKKDDEYDVDNDVDDVDNDIPKWKRKWNKDGEYDLDNEVDDVDNDIPKWKRKWNKDEDHDVDNEVDDGIPKWKRKWNKDEDHDVDNEVDDDIPKWKRKWNKDEDHDVDDVDNDIPKWKRKWNKEKDTDVDNDIPKWKRKWNKEKDAEEKRCDAGCTYTSKDGTKGRVCDSSCNDGKPYGTRGCSAKSGKYGKLCRVCFNDVKMALERDSPGERTIMCDTLAPASIYSQAARSLGTSWQNGRVTASNTARELERIRRERGHQEKYV